MKNLSTSVLLSSTSKQQLLGASSSKLLTKESGPTSHVNKSSHSLRQELNHRGCSDNIDKQIGSNETSITIQSKSKPISSSIKPTIIPLRGGDESTDDLSIDTKKKRHKFNDHTQVSLFGVDISQFPVQCQCALLIAIILAGFLSIGYVEEGFKFEFDHFSFGWFMTAAELIIFSLFAMVERLFKSLGKITSAVYLSSASTLNLNLPQRQQEQLESEAVSLISSPDHSEDAGDITTSSSKQKNKS